MLGDIIPTRTGELEQASAASLREAALKRAEVENEEFLLYPPRVLGYSTKEKIWGQFSVDQTSNVIPPTVNLFKEQLQLDERYKKMIEALVEDHGGRSEKHDPNRKMVTDLVENKGEYSIADKYSHALNALRINFPVAQGFY
jgi:hypothetical protein